GHWLTLEAMALRRSPLNLAPTSRDDFWQENAAFEAEVRFGETWSLRGRADGEAFQYRQQDSVLFFDQALLRFQLGPRVQPGLGWSVWAGPRFERLSSALQPAEAYREIGGAAEIGIFLGQSWWSLAPAAGLRDYDDPSGGALPGIHSSFVFTELQAFGDQPIAAGLRLRLFATARFEDHDDSTQDARSLYFSFDVRRLF
ncbi:MAG: hypothetical protein ACRDQ2_17440, partial [Gaiellales bacterium]